MYQPQRMFLAASVVLTAVSGLPAERPAKQARFSPNYVVIEDVTLSAPNGKARDTLKQGTLVAARSQQTGILDVKTEDGKFGRASSRFFSRLGSSIRIDADARQVAKSSNEFAFDLYQQAREQDGNLFFSPASVSTALAMTYAGAAGPTQQEMAAVLHFAPEQHAHQGFATLLELLNSTGDRHGYSLSTGNRLWGSEGYRFEDAFLTLTREVYRAKLETLNFGQPEQARQSINRWVAEETRDKINDLIPAGFLSSGTRLVLTNAIYFESGWSSEFSRRATKKSPFQLMATDRITVLTMEQTETFPYTEDADAQILSMPYRGHELSMVVVLPRKIDGLAELESGLTSERFNGWMKGLRRDRPAETYLPKFRMRSRLMLSQALKSMGMSLAFSTGADFSAMSQSEGLMISEVIHQAFVNVDEKGTEAAAATAVLMAPTAAVSEPAEPPKPIVFRADHPFLFLIRDNRTGAVLFMGRMLKPEAA